MNKAPSREETLFAEALVQPTGERGAFLAKWCGSDAAMLARIAALVAAHDGAQSLMDSAPIKSAAVQDEKPGDWIGRYKLLQKIGEGGCGVVWMAEQEEPVRRRVALKVIKLGMDTKAVVARFEAERQALAMMDHPNIARVLDGGATETGRPFFVMELVRGIPITRFCDDNNLPTRERLNLFIQVCHAIQHAHQKGIIHRDIKPSNVLVTLHDDVAMPAVIDFGIAKATQGRLTDSTLFTAFEQFIGTPVYMSPEQAEYNALDVDTRSDIYSLGVLLYELLTGRPPFDPKTLTAAGLDQVRKIIRESEPPRPSTRFRTLADEERTTVAKLRGIAPAQLSTLLRGDLDWIAMKALEKNRTRRYQTANAFAMDVQRYLANEPIVARPPSAAYRLRKTIARNKLAFGAGAVVATSLIAGLSFSTTSLIRERTARQRAESAEASSRAAEKLAVEARMSAETLLSFLFTDLGEELGEAWQYPLLRRVSARVLTYYDNLPSALQTRETRACHALAIVGVGAFGWMSHGRSADAPLGEPATRRRFEEAVAIMREIEASGPLSPFMRVAYAGVLWAMVGQSFREGNLLGAPPLCSEAENQLVPILGDPRWGEWADRAIAMIILGKAWLQSRAETEVGIPEYRRALTRAEQTLRERPHARNELRVAEIRVRFSNDLLRAQQRREARRLNDLAIVQLRALISREPMLLAARAALGRASHHRALEARLQWRFSDARAALEAGIAEFQQVAKSDPTTWGYHGNIAGLWCADDGASQFHLDWLAGDFAAAESDLRNGIELWSQPWADRQSRTDYQMVRFGYARLCAATGRDAEATRQLEHAANLRQRMHSERPWLTSEQRELNRVADESARRSVELQRLNWPMVRSSAEELLRWNAGDHGTDRERAKIRREAQRDLMVAAFHAGDFDTAGAAFEAWNPNFALTEDVEIQDRFETLGNLLWRVHLLARSGAVSAARTELTGIWPDVERIFAAGADHLFNQVQTARAYSIRAEIDGTPAEKRAWLERAAGWLRPAAAAGKLTRYEREVLLAAIEKQLAALMQP